MEFSKFEFGSPRAADRKDIVEFVQEVEKHACVYDRTSPDYANRVVKSRAWSEIAKKFNSTVAYCKDKWRKIRISFARSLKLQQTMKSVQPYYLTDELHFLVPFIKMNPSDDTPPTKEHKMDFEVATVIQHETSESDYDSTEDNVEEIRETKDTITYNDNFIPNIINRSDNTNENGVKRHIESNVESVTDCSPRKMFLFSMLPEIESFTEPEMRIFRREVINVVDNILNKRDAAM